MRKEKRKVYTFADGSVLPTVELTIKAAYGGDTEVFIVTWPHGDFPGYGDVINSTDIDNLAGRYSSDGWFVDEVNINSTPPRVTVEPYSPEQHGEYR
jgi:hypothetical protein